MRLRLSRPVAVVGVTLLLAGTAVAAQQLTSRIRPPASAIVTIAASAPLFNENALLGGERIERCTSLRTSAPARRRDALRTASVTDLSPWLNVELIRGTLPAPDRPATAPGSPPTQPTTATARAAWCSAAPWPRCLMAPPGSPIPPAGRSARSTPTWCGLTTPARTRSRACAPCRTSHWGVTPFDNRPDEAYTDDSPPRLPSENVNPPAIRQCTSVSFRRPLIGARAISKPKQIKAVARRSRRSQTLGVGADEVSRGRRGSVDDPGRRARTPGTAPEGDGQPRGATHARDGGAPHARQEQHARCAGRPAQERQDAGAASLALGARAHQQVGNQVDAALPFTATTKLTCSALATTRSISPSTAVAGATASRVPPSGARAALPSR